MPNYSGRTKFASHNQVEMQQQAWIGQPLDQAQSHVPKYASNKGRFYLGRTFNAQLFRPHEIYRSESNVNQ